MTVIVRKENVMDRKIDREFVYVHQNREGNKLSSATIKELMDTNKWDHCVVNEYKGIITISCQGLRGLGHLISMSTEDEDEGPDLRFFGSLKSAIVKFIG